MRNSAARLKTSPPNYDARSIASLYVGFAHSDDEWANMSAKTRAKWSDLAEHINRGYERSVIAYRVNNSLGAFGDVFFKSSQEAEAFLRVNFGQYNCIRKCPLYVKDNHYYYNDRIVIFDDSMEYQVKKERALSKLSEEDRQVLGLL